jgi:hydroxyacylglutathione hydrolase
MEIRRIMVGLLQANCYLVWDAETREAMVIDPGGNAKEIKRMADEQGLKLQYIVHTHGHWDHTSGSDDLAKRAGVPVYRHPAEPRSGIFHQPKTADGEKVLDLEDGQELKLGSLRFKVIATPGHSRGSVCIYGGDAVFSGDLLFQGNVGRWDLKGGSFRELVNSLNQRLSHLPDSVRVMPGHGPETAMGDERKSNPFFKSARELKRGK